MSDMESPDKYAFYAHGYASRLGQPEGEAVLLKLADVEAKLAIAAAIDRLADVLERQQR